MNRTTVEEIKARLPIEDVIGSYLKLEKSGKSMKAKCPFHQEKTASFFVSPDRGGYYCFGCGAKGDIFSFVEQFEGLDFKGALKVLADKAGVPLVFDQKADSEKDKLFQIMEEATKYFEGELQKSTGATEYIKKRGLTENTRKEFRVGYAPEGWRNLYSYLRSKSWPNDLIERAGLAKKAEDTTGNYYDRFRGRVMFPISDSSGRVVAFSGRILKDDGQSAKYLNSPDTPLFDKSSVLFGLDKAKSYVRRLDYSILVEGQMDLIMSHQAGVKNTVAASGTALTDVELNKTGAINNLGLLRRLSGNVIIAFDSDAAGRKAAMRAASIALSLGMDVKIADIQGGKDPADLVLNNPEDWKNVLRKAKPVIEFELNNVMKEVTDPRKVPRVLRDRVFPFVAAVESQTDKAYFVKMISEKANLPEQAIWEDVKAIDKKIEAESASDSTRAFGGRGGREAGAGLASDSPKSCKAPDAGRGGSLADSANPVRRIDLVERRMFGLLDLMEKASHGQTVQFIEQIKKIAGDSYDEKCKRAKIMSAELAFEAEAFFGNQPERWDIHMRDLITNFEEDIITHELIETMNELRRKE
ncbi:MAG: DNA primase, partial [Candidatus Taylorbacteria bacterium]|nr:DNA primase [Candidatus Taylorbacteria bacterium]